VVQAATNIPQLSPAERKRQLAQLAELGVAVPEDYRREVAMAGDWQVLSQRFIQDELKNESAEDKPTMSVSNTDTRKRKLEGQDDEEQDSEPTTRRIWGSTVRDYPSRRIEDDTLDALLASTTTSRREGQAGAVMKLDGPPAQGATDGLAVKRKQETPFIKEEESFALPLSVLPTAGDNARTMPVKEEDGEPPGVGLMFKKRKPKPFRQK
jgi:hypothetical protein